MQHADFPPVLEDAPFKLGAFRLTMGLVPLDLHDWIEPDEHLVTDLQEKDRLLHERYDDVFAVHPEAAPGSTELLALLVKHLPARFPNLYRRAGDRIDNLATGQRWALASDALHPLDLAGRLVQEDLCLMRRAPGETVYRLVGASLCFPTRWRLAQKMGQSVRDIHAPVPGYDTQLASTMDRFFDRLRTGPTLREGIRDCAPQPPFSLHTTSASNGSSRRPRRYKPGRCRLPTGTRCSPDHCHSNSQPTRS